MSPELGPAPARGSGTLTCPRQAPDERRGVLGAQPDPSPSGPQWSAFQCLQVRARRPGQPCWARWDSDVPVGGHAHEGPTGAHQSRRLTWWAPGSDGSGRYDGGQLSANAVPGGPSAQVSGYPAGQDAAGGSKRAIRVESPYSPTPPSSWPRRRRRRERHQGEAAFVRHRSLTELEDGETVREEVEQRVVEVGSALRTSHYMDWQPSYRAVGNWAICLLALTCRGCWADWSSRTGGQPRAEPDAETMPQTCRRKTPISGAAAPVSMC
jgi:hypothetical protein